MVKNKNNKDSSLKELSVMELKTNDLALLDKNDKAFMITYLFIFIFGIILTMLSS